MGNVVRRKDINPPPMNGELRLTDSGSVLISAAYQAWKNTLAYLPDRVDVTCKKGELRISPGLRHSLDTSEERGDVLTVEVRKPSRELRRYVHRANKARRVKIISRDGMMVLVIVGQASRNENKMFLGALAGGVVGVMVALGTVALLGQFAGNASASANNTPKSDQGALHSTSISDHAIKKLVEESSHGQATFVRRIDDADSRLTGIVIKGSSENPTSTVAWVLPGAHPRLIVGSVFTHKGQNLTFASAKAEGLVPMSVSPDATKAIAPGPSASPDTTQDVAPGPDDVEALNALKAESDTTQDSPLTDADIYKKLSSQKQFVSISQPDSPDDHSLFVFFDPNCVFCHQLWQHLSKMKDALAANSVVVKWVPVAVLSKSSVGKAAAVVKGGMSALEDNEQGYDVESEEGGVAPTMDVPALRGVRANTMLLLARGHNAYTPTLLWKDASGQVRSHIGSPSDDHLRNILESMTG